MHRAIMSNPELNSRIPPKPNSRTPFADLKLPNENDPDLLLGSEVREDLSLVTSQTWQFLLRHLDPNTALPIDRVEQLAGDIRLVEVTSPTNIALALLSCITANQLGYADVSETTRLVSQMLESLETLETCQGFFLNWYHTDSCKPVECWPALPEETNCPVEKFVSSVDNGWLVAGLLMAKECLPQLQTRVDHLLKRMNFKTLFNETNSSFFGGIHQTGRPTDYCYPREFLSEARILYYVSFLLGHIDRKVLIEYLDNMPSLSYGGSIFEALMPLLAFDEHLSSDTIFTLIKSQQQAGAMYGYWGYSPCDDPGSTYKEFGTGAYETNGFEVVTPHALMLTLSYAPYEVLTILQRLVTETLVWSKNGFVDSANVVKNEVSNSWLFLDQAMIFLAISQLLSEEVKKKKITV